MHRRSLPIAQPCHEDFDAMEPDGARRHCERCQTAVHDLGAMTRVEAHDFLRQHQGREVCVRYRVGTDGALRFAPAPPVRAAAPLLVVAMAGLMAACTGYVDAMELEIPDETTCVDEAGYSIPCEDAPDVIPLDESTDEPAPEPDDETAAVEDEPMPVLDDESYVMGGLSVELVEPLPPPVVPEPEQIWLGQTIALDPQLESQTEGEDAQGCPLQQWDRDPATEEGELMGRIEAPRYTRREERRIKRELRRERRARGRG